MPLNKISKQLDGMLALILPPSSVQFFFAPPVAGFALSVEGGRKGGQEDDDSLFRLQRPDRVRDSTPRPECEGKKEASLDRPAARVRSVKPQDLANVVGILRGNLKAHTTVQFV